MAFSTGGSSGATAEINVTPLIDVLLVLLIIFMVIVPVTPRGLHSLLPQPATAGRALVEERPIVVRVQSQPGGEVAYQIDQHSVTRTDMVQALGQLLAARRDKVMFVRGDRDLQFSSIAEVVAAGHQASAKQIGILTTEQEASR